MSGVAKTRRKPGIRGQDQSLDDLERPPFPLLSRIPAEKQACGGFICKAPPHPRGYSAEN